MAKKTTEDSRIEDCKIDFKYDVRKISLERKLN